MRVGARAADAPQPEAEYRWRSASRSHATAAGAQWGRRTSGSKCPACKEMAFRKEVERNLNVCPKCGYHLRADRRAAACRSTIDRGHVGASFTPTWRSAIRWSSSIRKPYPKRLEQARRSAADATTRWWSESAKSKTIRWRSRVMDFDFMGGSMGVVVGEKLARLFDHAGEQRPAGGGVLSRRAARGCRRACSR